MSTRGFVLDLQDFLKPMVLLRKKSHFAPLWSGQKGSGHQAKRSQGEPPTFRFGPPENRVKPSVFWEPNEGDMTYFVEADMGEIQCRLVLLPKLYKAQFCAVWKSKHFAQGLFDILFHSFANVFTVLFITFWPTFGRPKKQPFFSQGGTALGAMQRLQGLGFFPTCRHGVFRSKMLLATGIFPEHWIKNWQVLVMILNRSDSDSIRGPSLIFGPKYKICVRSIKAGQWRTHEEQEGSFFFFF